MEELKKAIERIDEKIAHIEMLLDEKIFEGNVFYLAQRLGLIEARKIIESVMKGGEEQ